jgi:hypothetical protein
MTATHCYRSNLAIRHPSSLIRPQVIQKRFKNFTEKRITGNSFKG